MNPIHTITIRRYDELHRFVNAFAAGHLNLLILIGSAGIAKSQTVKQAIGEACWLEGNATAFGMYSKLYRHQDELVVIDDVDSLYSNRAAVRLLKCLCQTDPKKHVAWESGAFGRDTNGIPREFETTSRVIIIANDWKTLDQNVAAVQDRGHLVSFEPPAEEVHRQVGQWFWDQTIYDWFGEHLHLVPNHSMRHYVRAYELQVAGINWVEHLLAEIPEKTRLVAEIRANPTYGTEKERIAAFRVRGGGARSTYFEHRKKLRTDGTQCERIELTVQPPSIRAA